MKQLVFLFCFTLGASTLFGHSRGNWSNEESKRSDTLDITRYEVFLDWTSGTMQGLCKIYFKSKMNGVDRINLDLLKLSVTGVLDGSGNPRPFNYNDSILSVAPGLLNQGDTASITVLYTGTPWHENWGGWHIGGGYSFNLGVGFESIPHNLGKVWHPCFDNFVERATYIVTIRSNNNTQGIGSGILINSSQNGGVYTNTWFMQQEIPTYLYGIAIADYTEIKSTIQGIYGSMPVSLYARSSDVSAVNNAFRNLDSMYVSYERAFGPYRWDRVGYSMTTIGAMEHATNIAYPISALSSESTIAHELSHHWWGNLITCETDRDMWINEGMAVFCEYIFQEDFYGINAMNDMKEGNLYQVVRNAHLNEGGYQPISGVPRVHTYGTHTYRKGSLVAHNMRKYLGDAIYFDAMKAFLDSNQFEAVNSYDFRDFITNHTGVDMTAFFDEWVFGPGMPDYQLWSWSSEPTPGLNDVSVVVQQNKAGSNSIFTGMPLTIRFWQDKNQYWDEVVKVQTAQDTFKFQFPNEPVYVELNPEYEITYAATSARDTLFANGSINNDYLDLNMNAGNVVDTTMVRAQTHWTGPYISKENQIELGVRVNPNRYWKISGFGVDTASITATSFFDADSNKIDWDLIRYDEDSLILLYRPMNGKWEEYDNYNLILGTPGDNRGVVQIMTAKAGEYVLAERDSTIKEEDTVGVNSLNEVTKGVQVYPNPNNGIVFLNPLEDLQDAHIHILNLKGHEIEEFHLEEFTKEFQLDLSAYPNGVYFYIIESDSGMYSGRFIKGKYSK